MPLTDSRNDALDGIGSGGTLLKPYPDYPLDSRSNGWSKRCDELPLLLLKSIKAEVLAGDSKLRFTAPSSGAADRIKFHDAGITEDSDCAMTHAPL